MRSALGTHTVQWLHLESIHRLGGLVKGEEETEKEEEGGGGVKKER